MTATASPLRALQVALHDHLLGRASGIAGELCEGGRIGVDARLHIYHHAYRARLLDVLKDGFEKTWAYLGDDAFEAAAGAYIESDPPRHRNLRWYGAAFVPWLAGRFPANLEVSEVATIDWALRGAFDGGDAAPIAATALSGLGAGDWASAGCRFAPTLQLTPVRFNAAGIWHALDRGETPPSAVPLGEQAWLMVWRKEWQPHFRTIGGAEHAALVRLRDGDAFAAACVDASDGQADPQAALALAAYLRTWIDDGLIVGLTGIGPPSGAIVAAGGKPQRTEIVAANPDRIGAMP